MSEFLEKDKKRLKKKQERLIKEQQDAARRKEEWLLREKQEAERKEQERLLKAKQETERKELIQSLVEQYHNECHKINLEFSAKRAELESIVQNEINQAQKQILELQKQKVTFTLFKRKRDTELDAKISVLDKRITEVKKNLTDELTKCEQSVKEKKEREHQSILRKAEEANVKESVKRALKG